MANYDEMSDLEINKLVADHLGLLVADESNRAYSHDYRHRYPSTIWVARHEYGKQTEPWRQANFILAPNDAWPLISENRINIEWRDSLKVPPLAKGTGGRDSWHADSNVLRAAMICFLKMKECE